MVVFDQPARRHGKHDGNVSRDARRHAMASGRLDIDVRYVGNHDDRDDASNSLTHDLDVFNC